MKMGFSQLPLNNINYSNYMMQEVKFTISESNKRLFSNHLELILNDNKRFQKSILNLL